MLLEALISIAIFSIGILGLIGLQSAALKSANDARQRAAAAFYANQIIGTMWSDFVNLKSYEHNPNSVPGGLPCTFSGAASKNSNVDKWISELQGDLNGLTSAAVASSLQQITVDSASNRVVVTLCWKNPEETVYHALTTAAQIRG
jgi:type IV pilus assembly protein PilV